MDRIIEGLHINEGSSVFSSKLNKFLEDLDKEDIQFIKSIINSIYINLGKEYNGYIEGKRPVLKDKTGYKYMTWKMQTNKSTRYEFYNIMRRYMSVVQGEPFNMKIDGTSYLGVSKGIDSDEYSSPRQLKNDASPDKSIFVGVYSAGYANEKVDPSKEGDTFKFIVCIPTGSSGADNPDVEKQGQKYIFKGKGYSVTYDTGSKEFEVQHGDNWLDSLVTIYKPSRNSEKAFKEMYLMFTDHTPLGVLTKIIDKHNIRVSTSWYPGLD